jgi:hypothetical protein
MKREACELIAVSCKVWFGVIVSLFLLCPRLQAFLLPESWDKLAKLLWDIFNPKVACGQGRRDCYARQDETGPRAGREN